MRRPRSRRIFVESPTPTTARGESIGGEMLPSALRWVLDLEALAERVEILEARNAALEKRLEALALPSANPITVKQLAAKYEAFSESRLRWMLFHRKTNGLDRAVIQGRGGRLLVDERSFLEWVAEGRESLQGETPQPKQLRRTNGARPQNRKLTR